MPRKSDKPEASGAGSPEEGAGGGTPEPGSAASPDAAAPAPGGEGTARAAEPDAETQALLEGLRGENDGLRKENGELRAQVQALIGDVDAIARSRDAAFQERDAALEASKTKARRRSEEKLLPLLERLSRESQRAGDRSTHAALERVIVAFAEVRHAVREGVKSSKGDGLDFLEDIEESL